MKVRRLAATRLILTIVSGALLLTIVPPGRSATFPAGLSGGDNYALLQSAQRQFDAGNYAYAIQTFQSALEQSPNSAQIYYWLGRSYFEVRDYDKAIANGEKSVSLDGRSSIYHHWLGREYGAKADRDRSFLVARKVKKELEAAIQLNPANIAARRDLLDFDLTAPWVLGGDKVEAKAQVDAIAAIDPIQGHVAQAIFYMDGAKRPDLAESEYRQILAAKPSQLEPYLEVAGFYEGQGNASGLQATVDAARRVGPNDPRVTFFSAVAKILTGAGQSQADEDLKSYIASTPVRSDWPSHAAAREWLGRLYEKEGKPAEAAEQYRASLQLDPQRKDARARLQQLEKGAR